MKLNNQSICSGLNSLSNNFTGVKANAAFFVVALLLAPIVRAEITNADIEGCEAGMMLESLPQRGGTAGEGRAILQKKLGDFNIDVSSDLMCEGSPGVEAGTGNAKMDYKCDVESKTVISLGKKSAEAETKFAGQNKILRGEYLPEKRAYRGVPQGDKVVITMTNNASSIRQKVTGKVAEILKNEIIKSGQFWREGGKIRYADSGLEKIGSRINVRNLMFIDCNDDQSQKAECEIDSEILTFIPFNDRESCQDPDLKAKENS
jgi:hypothetical protein